MWLVAAAAAAPVFVSEDPHAVRLATQAWRLATQCAGVQARAAETVPIELGDPGGGFLGRAYVQGDGTRVWRDGAGQVVRTEIVPGAGLRRIRVRKVQAQNIAHEVAHAWSTGGPPALVEGGAELLAACISRLRPGLFPPPPRDDLGALVDLRAWTNGDDADAAVRSAGYAAAYRMFRIAARTISERSLWRRDWTWDAFDALLRAEGGALGVQLVSVLDGGAAAQRAALTDPDDDGLVSLEETARGTDPARWDTDGDGWWDGAEPELLGGDAVPLPVAGRPECSGRRAGPRGARVVVEGGGPNEAPPPRLVVDMHWMDDARDLPPHASILFLAVRAGWGNVRGSGLVRDDRCWSGGRWAVVAAPGLEKRLPAFVEALARADARADALLEAPDGRALVRLGDRDENEEKLPPTYLFAHTTVPTRWLTDVDFAAALTVATEWLRRSETRPEPSLREALARRLVDAPPAEPFVAKNLAHVEAWTATVAACDGEWRGLVAGKCAAPERAEEPEKESAEEPEEESVAEGPSEPEDAEGVDEQLRGAAATQGALQLGADRMPVCSGWAAGPNGAVVVVQGGKADRDGPAPRLYPDGRELRSVPSDPKPYEVAAGASLLLGASSPDAGWGAVGGTGLVPDHRCWSDTRWTVLARPGQEGALARFVEALHAADTRADALLDAPARRLLVLLGDESAGLSHRYTAVRSGWLEGEDLAYVAAYAVASERLRAAPITKDAPAEVGLYEALARSIVAKPPAVLLAAMDESDLAPWLAAVKACKGGWRAYAAGVCAR